MCYLPVSYWTTYPYVTKLPTAMVPTAMLPTAMLPTAMLPT